MSYRTKDMVGREFETLSYGPAKVIEYVDCNNVLVEFLNTGHTDWFQAGNIRLCKIMDVMAPAVSGVGYVGVGDYRPKINSKAYKHWAHMLQRCYEVKDKFRNYFDKEVSEDWRNFQNFAAWAEVQIGFDKPRWQLDKDILSSGNKIYSPETCCFVPPRVNSLILRSNPEGHFVVGWGKWVFTYRECDGKKVNASFILQEDGKMWYKRNKERVVKDVAEQYKNVLDIKVYDALYSWQVS